MQGDRDVFRKQRSHEAHPRDAVYLMPASGRTPWKTGFSALLSVTAQLRELRGLPASNPVYRCC